MAGVDPAWIDGLALVGRATSLGVGAIFASAALGKLRHRVLFPGVLANYRILPEGLVAPVAAILPWAELALALVLIGGAVAGPWAPAVLAAMALLLLFAWAMAVNLRRGRAKIDCGCGHSALRQPLAWPLVVRNAVLAGSLAPALAASTAPVSGTWPLALAGGLMLFVLFQLFNAILALAASPLGARAEGNVR